MLELLLCSAVTILPDFLYRRFVQGKRIGREITLFSVWYELRWGITLCLILTISLITTIFYFHPSTIERRLGLPHRHHPPRDQRPRRRDLRQHQPACHPGPAALPPRRHRAGGRDRDGKAPDRRGRGRRWRSRKSQLAEAEGRIVQARGSLQQAQDEYDIRAELMRRNPNAISQREVDRAQVAVDTAQGAVDAGIAGKAAVQSQIDFQLPAREGKRRGRAAAGRGRARRRPWSSPAPTASSQQFALRPGDVVNPMLRPAGILVPDRARDRPRRRLRPDRGAGDEGRHGRRGHLHRRSPSP